MTRIHSPFLAAALLASVAAVGVSPAFAQASPPPARHEIHRRAEQHMLPGQRVAGQVAYLKAELKITPAQESLWAPVAVAMRDNAQALDHTIMNARQQKRPLDALQRVSLRSDFAAVRAQNEARFLAAFKPLYAGLTPAQQQQANELFAPHHGWHHHA